MTPRVRYTPNARRCACMHGCNMYPEECGMLVHASLWATVQPHDEALDCTERKIAYTLRI